MTEYPDAFDTHVDRPPPKRKARGNGTGSDQSSHRQRFTLIPFDDLKPSTGRRYLIKRMIPRHGLTLVWGPPKCGKSFWAFDAVMHIALGRQSYRGHRVHPGAVVYVALEGQQGMNDRAEAFRREHNLPARSPAKFHLIADALELVSDRAALVAAIKEALQGSDPVAVVIDTVNRSFQGSESSDEDMTAYVQAADAIWQAFQAAVILVHHCGHEGSRPRGHSALLGAVHAQIAVKRDAGDNIITTVEHMKDGPEGEAVASRLEVVEVGIDDDGEPITSCIIVEADADATTRRKPVCGQARIALDLLNRAVIDAGEIPPASNHIPGDIRVVPMSLWRSYCFQGGICKEDRNQDARKKAFKRAADKLQGIGRIGVWDEWVWPA
jgi:hypothetical protein